MKADGSIKPVKRRILWRLCKRILDISHHKSRRNERKKTISHSLIRLFFALILEFFIVMFKLKEKMWFATQTEVSNFFAKTAKDGND